MRRLILLVVIALLAAPAFAQTPGPLLPPTDTPAAPLTAVAASETSAAAGSDSGLLELLQTTGFILVIPLALGLVLLWLRLRAVEKRLDDALDTIERQARDLKEVERAVHR